MSGSNTCIMFDTNVIISAILNERSTPNKALMRALEPPYVLVLCDQILDELRRIFNRKFPDKIQDMERFLSIAHYVLIIANKSNDFSATESAIRDPDDRPILRAALDAKVALFVTGDKDFLESTVQVPQILTAAQFLQRK
jgi:putative PIN family toxin of toxin-antitoxin system